MNLASSIITLEPGMYILRHPKTGMPPLSVSRAPSRREHNGVIQALYTPGSDGSVLRDRRDCIVMQVLNAPVDLLVTAYLEQAGAAVPAMQIDKIAVEGDVPSAPPKTFEVAAKGISIIGHIERTGDIVAAPGKTLGDPESNLRVEGFQVMWPDKPEGIELTYSAKVEGVEDSPTAKSGQFAGTRNAARRIVGVTFALTGAKAESYRLDGEAFFSGGYKTSLKTGDAAQGPTGMEHLTGLRINVAKANPWTDSPRTRVIKGKKK